MVRLGRSAASQCGFTRAYHVAGPNQNPSDLACGEPYQTLPRVSTSCARGAKVHGGFGLVTPPITNAYQPRDLAWTLPRVAFTKHRRLVIAIGIICYENYVCGELM